MLSDQAEKVRQRSRAGYKIRCQPIANVLRNDLYGAVFGVAPGTLPREALFRTGNVVRRARKGGGAHHGLLSRNFDQTEGGIEAFELRLRPATRQIGNHGRRRRPDSYLELVCRRDRIAAAVEIVQQRVAEIDRQTGVGRTLQRGNIYNVNGTEL